MAGVGYSSNLLQAANSLLQDSLLNSNSKHNRAQLPRAKLLHIYMDSNLTRLDMLIQQDMVSSPNRGMGSRQPAALVG
jgi:hypothetical protein